MNGRNTDIEADVVDDPGPNWEQMAKVSRRIEPEELAEPEVEKRARVTASHLAKAADYLDTPESREIREKLVQATERMAYQPDAGRDLTPPPDGDNVPVYLEVDPYLAALICQHQLGRLGMANCTDLSDIGHVVAGYLADVLAARPAADDDVMAWVGKIHALHIDQLGRVETDNWPPNQPEETP